MAKQEKPKAKRSDRIIGRRYRYTGDYQVVPAIGSNGRPQKQLLYTGDWVMPLNEPEEYRRLVRWLRMLTAVAAAAVVCATQVLPAPTTNKWFLPVLVVSFFPLAYQIMGAFRMPAERKRMERQEYDKSFLRLRHTAVFTLVLICLSALGTGIYWIVAAGGKLEGAAPYSLRDGIFAGLLVLAAAAELLIRKRAGSLRTETVENAVRED